MPNFLLQEQEGTTSPSARLSFFKRVPWELPVALGAVVIFLVGAMVFAAPVILKLQAYQHRKLTDPDAIQRSVPGTSDWQTYRNEEYGFEVKYPDDFVAYNRQISPGTELPPGKIVSFTAIDSGEGPGAVFTIMVFDPEGLGIADWVTRYRPHYYWPTDTEIENIAVCDIAGKRYASQTGQELGYLFMYRGHLYTIDWHAYSLTPFRAEEMQKFLAVVSSFTCLAY